MDTNERKIETVITLTVGPAFEGTGIEWGWQTTTRDPEADFEESEPVGDGFAPRTGAPGEYAPGTWRRLLRERITIPGSLRGNVRAAGGKANADLRVTPDRIARFTWRLV